ncbi:MAG: methionyl-tRNA formyltransferase [Acidobacteriota bacterium]
MRLAFFGTPDFAVPSLAALETRHEVVAVVSQPDRPRGRGQKTSASPVAAHAERNGLTVFRPERIKTEEFLSAFKALNVDLAIVAAYGRILPAALLEVPPLGFINVHASLLPRWRGAAPIHRAVLAGDGETGVTIMRVVPALDAGPMLAKVPLAIGPDETTAELEPRLAKAGAFLLAEVVDRLAAGPIHEEPQDERLVTYAARIDRTEGRCNWDRPAPDIHNHIRGLQPWPLVSAHLHGRRVLLVRSQVASADEPQAVAPGTVTRVEPDGLVIAANPGTVRLLSIQPEGRSAMRVRDFLNGHRVSVGDRLEPVSS